MPFIIWNLEKIVTIDEMMIHLKKTYCLIRQYMPNKSQKWGLKVWCLTSSFSKFIWNFEMYCGKENIIQNNHVDPIPPSVPQAQQKVNT